MDRMVNCRRASLLWAGSVFLVSGQRKRLPAETCFECMFLPGLMDGRAARLAVRPATVCCDMRSSCNISANKRLAGLRKFNIDEKSPEMLDFAC